MSMLPEYLSDPIAYLLKRKFGGAVLIATSGLPENEEEAELFAEVQTYQTMLQGLEEDHLIALAYQEREKETRELEDVEEQSRSFNQPNAKADFEYWAKFPLWRLDEAVALTLGKDPRVVTWSKIEEYAETSPFAARFANLRRFVQRAKEAQQVPELVPPADYISWAKANNIDLPPELEKSVQAFSGTAPDWKALYEEAKLKLASVTDELERLRAAGESLGEKEKISFYKLLLGMAVVKYGYRPQQGRSPNARKITGDLGKVGISINEDTVRDKLQKAANAVGDDLLDDEY